MRQQLTRAERGIDKRARNKAKRAQHREEKEAYVQEALHKKRVGDVVTGMCGLEIVEGDAGEYAEGRNGRGQWPQIPLTCYRSQCGSESTSRTNSQSRRKNEQDVQ